MLDKLEMAIKILDVVSLIYPDAFIAGGYLRDIDNGHTPKDLDIFTFEPPKVFPLKEHRDRDEDYQKDSRIALVCYFDCFKIPTDVVHLVPLDCNDPKLVAIQNFALGIQQIKLDKITDEYGAKYESYYAEAYLNDKKNKTITITRCGNDVDATTIGCKITALREKYPWKVVIPDEFSIYKNYLLHDPNRP